MSGTWRSGILFFAVLQFSVAAGAADLIGLYRKALQHDADYRAVLANTEADREEISKARALFYPKAQLSVSRGRGTTDRTTQSAIGPLETHLNYTMRNYALSIRQPLFNKETMANYDSAKAYVSSQESLLEDEHGKLMLRVAEAYLQVLYTRERVSLLQSRIDAVTRQLAQARRKYERGMGTVVEVSEAQATLEMAVAEHRQAQAELEGYANDVRRMTGEMVDEDVSLDPERLPTKLQTDEGLDFWLENAENNNPEIVAARFAVEAAKQDAEKKRAGHYPTLDLVGVRSYSENDSSNTLGSSFDSTTVSVQLNVPLYSGGLVNANVRQAQNRLTAAQEMLESKSRETGANIRSHFNGFHSQVFSVQAYRQAVTAAELALDGTNKGFLAGMRTNQDVLEAQQKLFGSQLELSHARYQLVSSLINLKHGAGLLNEDVLTGVSQWFTGPANQH